MRTNPETGGESAPGDRPWLPSERVADALAHPRRRLVLVILRRGEGTTTETALASSIRAREPDGGEAVRTALRHRHLPTLAHVGLVEWDREAATVALAAHEVLDRPQLRAVTGFATGAHDRTWDELLPAVARPRRRTVLLALADADGPRSTAGLAAAVAARTSTSPDPDDPADGPDVSRIRAALRHVDLPVLAEVGLVDHDPEAGVASLREHPALEWLVGDGRPPGRPPTPVGVDGDD